MAVLQRGVGTGVHIDIYSDVICPWCYLGSRRVAAALERFGDLHPDEPVTLRWRAYELDPGAPAEPRPMRPVIERKYGPGAFDSMTARLTTLGAADGIDYRFEQTQRVNTFDAHRLVAWAAGADSTGSHEVGGTQDRLVDALFHAYFTDGRNVADHATLVEIAAGVGLDPDASGELLASDAFSNEVRTDEAAAREHDITGIPAVVVNGRALVPGAQDVDTFLRVFERVATDI